MSLSKNSQKVYCGVDFHKNTSTLYALSQDGQEVLGVTTVRSGQLVSYLSNKKDWVIGVEATGGSNELCARLKESGHGVVLINPNQFRGIGVGGKKTDARDAKALARALLLGAAPSVHLRSQRSREIKSLLVSREHLVQARVSTINHVRGTLREYGITLPAGVQMFYEHAPSRVAELGNGHIRLTLEMLLENIRQYKEQESAVERALGEFTQGDAMIERLQTIPGVGPITALMMVAVVDDITRFKNAQVFASYLGLVPTVSASANKRMMGAITRSGSEMLRRYLIHGARAWMRYAPDKDLNRSWAERVKDRRGMNKAVVALAHRLARVCFAVMRDQSHYKPRAPKSEQAA